MNDGLYCQGIRSWLYRAIMDELLENGVVLVEREGTVMIQTVEVINRC
jgi:hypothetical protein